MNGLKDRLLAVACLAIGAAWLVGWFVVFRDDLGGSALLLLVGFLLLAAIGGYWIVGRCRQEATALEYLSQLADLDAYSLENCQLPQLPTGSHWLSVATRIYDFMRCGSERLQLADQARAAMEVRNRRNSARFQQMEVVLASLPEPVIAVNGYDELILTNASAEELFHLPSADSGKRTLQQLSRCPQLIELINEIRKRKLPGHRAGEAEFTDSNGESHWYSITTRCLSTAGDSSDAAPPGAVAIFRDISSLKTSQKKNAEFVSAVSHEMKTPLAGIKAYVELLADGDAEDEATREEFLEVINGQANRLQRLIDNLLNLARIEAGVVSVSKDARSLNELLEETLGVVRPSAEAKNIELSSDLSGMYLGVVADRDMLMQAAINLLSNAIKYTPHGGKVTLRSRLVDDQVQFEVVDTGVGLNDVDQQRVFEKFYRVKKDSDMAPGTGLGLPLAKHIVEDVHGGQLTVRSKVGSGSTFTISMPSAGQLTTRSGSISDSEGRSYEKASLVV